MAQIKCRPYANRSTPRTFTSKDVGRIAKYAIQDGETEKAVIVQVALRVGYLREWLIKINDIVFKVLPVVENVLRTMNNLIGLLERLQSILVKVGAVLALFGIGEILLTISARIQVLKIDLQRLEDFVASGRDLVENFDISEIISDTSLVKEI